VSPETSALEKIERVVDRGGDADDVLREVVAVLHEHLGRFVRISFVENDGLSPGPAAGDEGETTSFPIEFERRRIAELELGGDASEDDRALLQRVATLLSPYALVGWDTGGEEWKP
jgi:hypothetical protein